MTVDTLTAKVSLAVRLTDEFTGSNRPLGEVAVSIQDRPVRPVQNRSGYHAFLNLAPGPIVIQVRSQWYLDEDRIVTLPLLNPLNPLLEVTLKPNSLYPFPQHATLIRGQVQGSDGVLLREAVVQLATLAGKQVVNRTGADGRFVLYVTGLDEDDVKVVGQDKILLPSTGTSFNLITSCAAYDPNTTAMPDIVEGRNVLLKNLITLHKI